MRIMKQLGSIDTTLSLFVGLTNVLGVRPILKNAKEEVKEQILPIISTGRELGAFALSEDGAGSNPLNIEMSAIPTENNTWLLNGKKIWSGASAWAGVINTFAKEYDSNGKLQGFTAYAVRQGTKGLIQGGEALTIGMRGLIQNTIYFNDVEVSELNILGERGKGMDVAQDAMMYGRLTIASACIGGMKRCLQFINNYASQRKVSTGLLIDNAVTRKKIFDISNYIVCIDVLVNKISKMIDQNIPIPQELYVVCKILAPEFFWTSVDHTIQILGGRGYVETNLLPQMMRDVRVLRIFEGPTETLQMYLGSKTINVINSIYDLIVNVLGESEVFEKLENSIEKVIDLKLTNKSSTDEKQIKQVLVSDLVCLSVIEAILLKEEQSIVIERALSFVSGLFNLKLKSLETENVFDSFDSRQDISELINTINEEIGQIEQNYPKEESDIDPLLKHVKNNNLPLEDNNIDKSNIIFKKVEKKTKLIDKKECNLFDSKLISSKFSPNKIWIIFADKDNKKLISDYASKNNLNHIVITSERKMMQVKDELTGEMIVSCQLVNIDFEKELNKIFDENGLLFYEIVYQFNENNLTNFINLIEYLKNSRFNFPKKLSIITNNLNNLSKEDLDIDSIKKYIEENQELNNLYKDIEILYQNNSNKDFLNKILDITLDLNNYNIDKSFKLINTITDEKGFILTKENIFKISIKKEEHIYTETVTKKEDINSKNLEIKTIEHKKNIDIKLKDELVKLILITILGEYREEDKYKTFLELGLDSLKVFELQHEISLFIKKDIVFNENIIKLSVENAVDSLLS